MLTQSTLSAPEFPLNPEPVFSPPLEGRWTGLGVAVCSGVVPFLQSLDPSYLPPNTQQKPFNGPAFTLCSGKDSGFLQGVELAARLASSCAGLSEEISNMLGTAISALAGLRFSRDQWAAMSDSVSEGGKTDHPNNNDKEKVKKAPAYKRQPSGKSGAAGLGGGQLPRAAVALGAMSCLATVTAQSPIEVADVQTLNKIGRDPNYPLDGRYRQSSDIDGGGLSQSIGSRSHPFTGQYDGQRHTIGNLQRCLVQTMGDGGHVDSLRFTDVNIHSTNTTGAVACEILDNALASNIVVKDACVATSGEEKFAGIGAGYVRGAVTNITVVNGTVMTFGTRAHAGISAGKLEGIDSAVTGCVSVNCKVSTFGNWSKSGIGAGHVKNGTVTDTLAVDSKVLAEGENAATGIGAGHVTAGTVVGTTGVNSKVSTNSTGSYVAIGAGLVDHGGIVNKTTGVRSQAIASVGPSYVGIGVGAITEGTVNNTVAVRCLSLNSGIAASAGIGAGNVDGTKGKYVVIDRTTSLTSKVSASGVHSNAGIGAGILGYGVVINTLAVHSEVLAPSSFSQARIGVGQSYAGSKIDHVKAIKCVIQDTSERPIVSRDNFERCNIIYNEENVSDTPRGCNCSLAYSGKYGAPGLVTEDCKPSNRVHIDIQQALRNIRHSYPLQLDRLNPQQVSQFGVCRTISFPPLSVTPAPLAAGLSSTAVVGMALGAVAACALVAGGAYLYYRYNRSDNSADKAPISLNDIELP